MGKEYEFCTVRPKTAEQKTINLVNAPVGKQKFDKYIEWRKKLPQKLLCKRRGTYSI